MIYILSNAEIREKRTGKTIGIQKNSVYLVNEIREIIFDSLRLKMPKDELHFLYMHSEHELIVEILATIGGVKRKMIGLVVCIRYNESNSKNCFLEVIWVQFID